MDKMDKQERLERTASMAYNKGLINNPGENNCFLNSAVQVLWHLDVFRRSFREIKGHYCMGQSCIFCALDYIFKQFQYSSNDALPPDGLRVALAVAFKNQHRFQLGDMDDAAECFENILSHMHTLVAKNEHDDACTAKHCISHQKFAMQLIEQTICQCGEQSEPLPFFQLVHYVSASALCAKARSLKGWDNTRPIENQFGVLLRRAGQDTRECQSPDCNDRVQVQRLLLNCPDIVSVGLIWDSESPDAEHIADVLQCIGTTLKLSDLYHQVYDERAKDACLQLVGIVTYYGKHYSTFFFHSKLRTWIYFDDARVKEIGSDWMLMMEKCRLCHYQPLLLLYANPQGTPINPDSGPKKKICVNGNARQEATDANQSGKGSRLGTERGVGDGISDSEKSPVTSKKSKSRYKLKKEEKTSPFHSKKSLSSGDLTAPNKQLARSPSNASDSAASSPSKEKHRPSFRRIGNAIMNAVNPALAVSHLKQSKKKRSEKSRRSSTGSSESSGDHDLIDFNGSKNEDAKKKIMKLYEQSKAMNAAQVRAANNDSGIGSAPSSAGGSVSSTDTNHGGSDEDLMNFNQTWRHSKYDNWPPDRIESLLQEAEKCYQKSEMYESQKDFVSALSFVTEAASFFRLVTEEHGVDLNTKNYAQMKRNACQARARNLRLLVQSSPSSDNGNSSVSFSKQKEEDQPPDRIESLLQEAEKCHQKSEMYESQKDFVSALSWVTEAATFFRLVTEEHGVDLKTKNYAQMKRNACQARARNLRLLVQSSPSSDNGNSSVSFSKQKEEDLLRQQRQRDHVIINQQQEQAPPPYMSVQRRDRLVKDSQGPHVVARRVHEVPVQSSKVAPLNSEYKNSWEEQYASTLPLKVKPTVYSSGHYVSKPQMHKSASSRVASGVCTKQIKPDSFCYSPLHYDRENEIAARIQNCNIRAPSPEPNVDYTTVITVGEGRPKISDNRRPPPPTRRVSSSVYISPSNSSNSRTSAADSYAATVYRSNERPNSATVAINQSRPKVFYAGNSEVNSQPSTRDRPPSPARSMDKLDSVRPARSGYSSRPVNYMPAPPYNSSHQREHLKSFSTSTMSKPWHHAGSAENLRELSPRIITDRPVCERCRCVYIDRRQRLCAGCQEELYQMHSYNRARLY